MGSEWQIVKKFRFFDYKIELVSKELNHLVAILQVYFCEVKINCYYFLKIDEIEFLTEGPVSPTVKLKVYL